jgi:hypothetical protein
MLPHSARRTKSLIAKAAELATAVPQVVLQRMTRMALAGPVASAADQREFQLMVTEKGAAFNESWRAVATEAARAHQVLTASFVKGLWAPKFQGEGSPAAMIEQLHNAAASVVNEGLSPVHRRAVRNAKRLAREKR